MRSFTLIALSLASLPFSALATAQDGPILLPPAAIGQIFCLGMVGNDMAPVKGGLITTDLDAAIDEAQARSDAWAAKNPGEKPPLGDGIPWSIVPDYAAECTVGDVVVTDGQALVAIKYGFPGYPEAGTSDALALVAVSDAMIGASRWRIDNVVFADDYDLRQALNLAFVDFD
jgi:hypothetical protein